MTESLLRSLRIISLGITAGLFLIGVLLIGIHFVILEQKPIIENQGSVPFWLLSLVSSVLACGVAVAMSGQLLKTSSEKILNGTYVPPPNAPPMALLTDVLIYSYRSAHLLRLMLVEGAGILGVVLFLLGGDLLILIGPGIAFSVLLVMFPTESKVMSWVNEQTEKVRHARGLMVRDEPPQAQP